MADHHMKTPYSTMLHQRLDTLATSIFDSGHPLHHFSDLSDVRVHNDYILLSIDISPDITPGPWFEHSNFIEQIDWVHCTSPAGLTGILANQVVEYNPDMKDDDPRASRTA